MTSRNLIVLLAAWTLICNVAVVGGGFVFSVTRTAALGLRVGLRVGPASSSCWLYAPKDSSGEFLFFEWQNSYGWLRRSDGRCYLEDSPPALRQMQKVARVWGDGV